MLDVREPVEVEQGCWKERSIFRSARVADRVETELPQKSTPVLVYCAGGVRSYAAAEIMKALGYADPISLAPGFNGWKQAGLPWMTPGPASPALVRAL